MASVHSLTTCRRVANVMRSFPICTSESLTHIESGSTRQYSLGSPVEADSAPFRSSDSRLGASARYASPQGCHLFEFDSIKAREAIGR